MRLTNQLIIAGFVFATVACTVGKPITSTVSRQRQRNLAADKVLISVFESGEVDQLDAIIDPAFVNHAATGDRTGLDSLKTGVREFQARMKTVKVELKRQLSDDEYVSDWVRFIGRDPGAAIEGMEVTRYVNGKAVEHWFFPNSQPRRN